MKIKHNISSLVAVLVLTAVLQSVLMVTGHFGPKTLRHQDSWATEIGADMSGHVGTGADMSVLSISISEVDNSIHCQYG